MEQKQIRRSVIIDATPINEQPTDGSYECKKCKGSGECSDCNGEGYLPHDCDCEYCNRLEGDECGTCEGTGECVECDGIGRVIDL